ncbi:M15 family metallopeptidase [Bacillus paramycoides]|uniref:M15 family metallopeptidase n=1 Tax=Bacillus paramycoides TaxID=2026194 RepID=UPI0015BFEECB|nr:M15 family metallopeptidase [Bacillus paramycoides]NWK71186.1 M15 family metallopeptidase [Bacillus paramycoides]
MKKIVIISAATIGIGITSFAYFGSRSPLHNKAKVVETQKHDEAKAAETQKHDEHPKEEIPAFPKAADTAKKIDENFSLVTNPDSPLVFVNKHRKLPDGYIPKDLTKPNVPFTSPKDKEKTLLRKDAATALGKMFQSAKEQGLELTAVSGYRSYKRQQSLHNTYIKRQGKAKADSVSAVPGTSEHQTGLAMDISSESAEYKLEPIFGETEEGKWVAAHAHEFGFVIRYLEDKTDTTEYAYEPWHLRYVGNPYATYLYQHHLTLEEAMGEKNK